VTALAAASGSAVVGRVPVMLVAAPVRATATVGRSRCGDQQEERSQRDEASGEKPDRPVCKRSHPGTPLNDRVPSP